MVAIYTVVVCTFIIKYRSYICPINITTCFYVKILARQLHLSSILASKILFAIHSILFEANNSFFGFGAFQ